MDHHFLQEGRILKSCGHLGKSQARIIGAFALESTVKEWVEHKLCVSRDIAI
ncbi:hypothetical protein RED65_04645 [Oceanobacter sp. RED65]|uniref:Uncharacterized protein n=1 Tax=Bermanella marisrubri TaxID=207949 RepID=Q1MZU1_9GAMM|nr:hypothetical protein RED65_04645 [Oceanobacter sp. RED65] [Bermanella marisrubri]